MRASTSSKVSRSIKYGRRRPGGASPRFARPLKSPSSRMRKGVSELGSTGRSLASASTSRVTEECEDFGMTLRLSHLRHAGQPGKEAFLEQGWSGHIQL